MNHDSRLSSEIGSIWDLPVGSPFVLAWVQREYPLISWNDLKPIISDFFLVFSIDFFSGFTITMNSAGSIAFPVANSRMNRAA